MRAASTSPFASGAKSTSMTSPGRQYDEACSTAGPLNPRCVTSSFSRNFGPRCACTSRPRRLRPTRSSSSPARRSSQAAPAPAAVRITFNPNCRASSYASPVAPIFGIDNPPVATTSALGRELARRAARHGSRPDAALDTQSPRTFSRISTCPRVTFHQQHVHDLARGVVAEQLPQRLLVPLDSVALDEFEKVSRLVKRQRRLRESADSPR